MLAQLDVNKYTVLPVNMSAQTTSNNVQAIIESRMEKRTKNVYVPQGGARGCMISLRRGDLAFTRLSHYFVCSSIYVVVAIRAAVILSLTL